MRTRLKTSGSGFSLLARDSKGFDELNSWLADQCIAICRKRKHPEEKTRTIQEVYEEEKASLIPAHFPFHGYIDTECRVSSTSLIRYDRNHYSVNSKLAGKTATVRASADRIKVISNGSLVGNHTRQFGRDKVIYDPWHYLRILERKPGAPRNGAPFSSWDLPPSISRVRKVLSRQCGGDREFVDILLAVQRHGVVLVEQACRTAIAEGTIQGEIILNTIARQLNPSPVNPANVPESLMVSVEPIADCSRYDSLREELPYGTA